MRRRKCLLGGARRQVVWMGAGLFLAGSGDVQADPKLGARVDALVESFTRAGAFQGVVLLAIEGNIVYERGFGKASFELDVDNTPRNRFHIASVSKPFTAAALLLLAERGAVDLHAPISELLPDYPRGEELTLDHLLTHTSGIPNINTFDEYDEWSRRPHSTTELVEHFRDRPLALEPGERYSYSNSNYNLIAHIIEKVSGESFGDFLKKNIFDPLGMKDTLHRGDMAPIIPRLASGYVPAGARDYARAPYLDWSIKTGNGSLVSSVHDLLRFDRALQNGTLLSPQSLESAYGVERGLGYGWYAGERFGTTRIYISGRSPGYTAHFERYVDKDRCFIVLSNAYMSPSPLMLEGLAALLMGQEYEGTDFQPPQGVDADWIEGFTGEYVFDETWFSPRARARIENRGDHLRIRYTGGEDVGYEFLLIPLGRTTFFDRTHGGIVEFEPRSEDSRWSLFYRYGRVWRAEPIPAGDVKTTD